MMKDDGKKRKRGKENKRLQRRSGGDMCKMEKKRKLTELINNPLKEQMLAKKKKNRT